MKTTRLLLLLALLCAVLPVMAQWTTSGNDIYNSNTGNVGIGTTTPGYKLDVNGNLRALTSFSIKDASGNTGTITQNQLTTAFGNQTGSAGSGYRAYTMLDNSVGSSRLFVGGTFQDCIFFNSSPQTGVGEIGHTKGGTAYQAVINLNDGKVGIGTATPSAKFHVNGTSKFTDQMQLNKTTDNAGIPAYLAGTSAGSIVDYQITGAISTPNYHTAQTNSLTFGAYGGTVSSYACAATKSNLHLGNVNATLPGGHYFSGSDNYVFVQGNTNIGGGGIAAVKTSGHIDGTATLTKYYGVLIEQVLGTGTITDKYGVYQVEAAAKNYFAGKLSIGTTAVSDYKLDVNGTGRVNSSLLVGSSPTSWLGESAGYALQVVGTNNSTAGNVGIHIQNRTTAASNAVLSFGVGPTDVLKSSIAQDLSRLTIYGSNDLRLAPYWNGNIEFYSPLSSSVLGLIKGTNGNMLLGTTTDAGYKLDVNGSTRLNNSLVVNTDGTVALGTVTNYPSGYKLAVAGNIIAEKVRVKLQSSTWPDYVFDKRYKLPSLREIEKFIQQHQHLPGVPSAAEVEKEGIDLGDNQAVLLKKIEELTLYVIEQRKLQEKQQQEIGQLKNRLVQLEAKQ